MSNLVPARTVVVVGVAKTGTTALYFKIKDAMPPTTRGLFEPRLEALSAAGNGYVVAKVLIGLNRPVNEAALDGFDRRIILTRDPRDIVVSRVLYDIYNEPVIWEHDANVAGFVDLLRRKEADPSCVSVCDLIECYDAMAKRPIWPRATGDPATALDFQSRHPDDFRYAYENLVRGEFSALAKHLGRPIAEGPATVPTEYSRVVRAKRQGDWRQWFTAEDVAAFRPHLDPYLEANGYGSDWTLPERQTLSPADGSDYVRRLVHERRRGARA